jgi:hypothetical protein
LLKDVYQFYKHSPKRKTGLNSTVLPFDQLFNAFLEAIRAAVEEGEEELMKVISIRLKKWNPTRWLGRAECLQALCNAYEYILQHPREYTQDSRNSKLSRETAANLYQRLTSYDNFCFIWLYRDLAESMARTSKSLQARSITIRDVGRLVMNLRETLKSSYPKDSLVPRALVGTAEANNILSELFGDDLNGTFQILEENWANDLAVHELEEALLPPPAVQIHFERSTQSARTTRKVDNSAKYSELLSKKSRQERGLDSEPEQVSDPSETEVVNILYSSLRQVYSKMEGPRYQGKGELLWSMEADCYIR